MKKMFFWLPSLCLLFLLSSCLFVPWDTVFRYSGEELALDVAAIYSIMLDCKLLVEQLGSANVSHLGDLMLQLITLLHCKKLLDLKLG